jgi:polyhydroxyalkanoate synthesis regulator phasin
MEQKQIVRQMMEFNKKAFDNSFSAMSELQDQTEKLMMNFLDKAEWVPEEGKKVMQDWIANYKKSRNDFKAAADDGYRKVAEFFEQAEKPQAAVKKKK